MSFNKYKIPEIMVDDKCKNLYVCDKCGVIIKTDGEEPKKCPVCYGEFTIGGTGELAQKHITIEGETMAYDEAGERFYEMFRGRGENG